MNTLSTTDVNEDMASRRRNLGLRSQHREESEKPTDTDTDTEVCKMNVESLKDTHDRSEPITVILNPNRMEADQTFAPNTEREDEMEFHACRDGIDENIDEDDLDVVTPVDPVHPPVSMRQRLISPSPRHALGRGDQSENSENMTKTVYGAVKGAIQEMSQTLVTTITKAFWNVSKERDDENDKRHHENRERRNHVSIKSRQRPHSRTAKHSRKSTRRKMYSDSSSSDDGEEEYHSEACTEDLDLGLPEKNPKKSFSVKLPPFTGEDDWKVWFNRFKTVAKRQHWTRGQKLVQLLPRLLGKAGDFVFGQLSQEKIDNYEVLVEELNNRFSTIETARSYKLQFNRRDQKPGETAILYGAELKRLYDKAYPNRNSGTRCEDLLRRFLDGLNDENARFQIEFVKDPADIDEAIRHVINFTEARKASYTDDQDKRPKKIARQVKVKNTKRPLSTQNNMEKSQGNITEEQSEKGNNSSTETEKPGNGVCEEVICMKREDLQNLMRSLMMDSQNRAIQCRTREPRVHDRTCFKCGNLGHFAKFCPQNSIIPNRPTVTPRWTPVPRNNTSRGGTNEEQGTAMMNGMSDPSLN